MTGRDVLSFSCQFPAVSRRRKLLIRGSSSQFALSAWDFQYLNLVRGSRAQRFLPTLIEDNLATTFSLGEIEGVQRRRYRLR